MLNRGILQFLSAVVEFRVEHKLNSMLKGLGWKMVKLSLKKFGQVNQPILDKILSVINESYEHLGFPRIDTVNLWIFEKSESESSFFATHDIWQEKPRIRLFLDKILEQPTTVAVAGIQRQVAHSILHGSAGFYILLFPEELKKAGEKYGLSAKYINELLYQIAMAVKEYEVTHFLLLKNLVGDQVTYCEHILKVSKEDIASWKIALKDPGLRALYILVVIRDISGAVPLASDERFEKKIRRLIQERIAYLPPDYQSIIGKITLEKFPLLGSNFKENIIFITRTVSREILEPELKELFE